MQIQYKSGDLFEDLPNVVGPEDVQVVMIPHVCNNVGAWGAGFVVPLGKRFPDVEKAYHDWHNYNTDISSYEVERASHTNDGRFKLGNTQFVHVVKDDFPKVSVANMIAQHMGGTRPLHYNALSRCMDDVATFSKSLNIEQIVCPMFGSGLAGGNWDFIEDLIVDCWLRKEMKVTVYYLEWAKPANWTPPEDGIKKFNL